MKIRSALSALFCVLFLSYCSPQYRFARLVRKNPDLIKTKVDTIVKKVTVIDTLTIDLPTDTVYFSEVLKEYVRESKKEPLLIPEENYKLQSRIKYLERELMKGVFKPYQQHFKIDSTSFDILFNPSTGRMQMINLQVPEKTIIRDHTVDTRSFWYKVLDWWWLFVLVLTLITVLLFFLRRNKQKEQ